MAASADGPALGISYSIAALSGQRRKKGLSQHYGTFEGTIAQLRYEGSIEGSIAPEPASIKAPPRHNR